MKMHNCVHLRQYFTGPVVAAGDAGGRAVDHGPERYVYERQSAQRHVSPVFSQAVK